MIYAPIGEQGISGGYLSGFSLKVTDPKGWAHSVFQNIRFGEVGEGG